MSINKTLYIRGEDRETWSSAELLAGGSVSALCAELLAAWLKEKDPDGALRGQLLAIREQVRGAR